MQRLPTQIDVDAVLAGMGICQLPHCHVRRQIAEGGLVPILTEWRGADLIHRILAEAETIIPRRLAGLPGARPVEAVAA